MKKEKNMPKQDYSDASRILKLFSHPTRIMIAAELLKGQRCVSGINKLIKVRQPNISQHLSLLKLNGIVESKQVGKEVCYCLKKNKLIESMLKFLEESRLV